MKIIALNGSPHGVKSTTKVLVDAVLAGAADEGAEVDYIDVCQLLINYCQGCGTCNRTGVCPQKDDFWALFAKMQEADGIVLASPVYIDLLTAQLKTVIDRMAHPIHCMLLSGTYGCSVSTAGSSMANEVVEYMNNFLSLTGVRIVGGIGVTMTEGPCVFEEKITEARHLGVRMVAAIAEEQVFPKQEAAFAKQAAKMRELVDMNRDLWVAEYKYWQQKG